MYNGAWVWMGIHSIYHAVSTDNFSLFIPSHVVHSFILTSSANQAKAMADKMIGHMLVTKQTGSHGRRVDQVMICERLYSRREYFFAITLDRKYAVSTSGLEYNFSWAQVLDEVSSYKFVLLH